MGVSADQLIEQTIRLQDQASGPLGKMAAAAGDLYGGILKVVGVGGLLGGALSLHGAWETTEKYVKNLKEVRDLTGATASETDFLFSSARKAGVEYEQMKGVMFQLSRRGAMLEQTMATTNGRVPGLAKKFQRLGVDMTKGPVKALENMSAAVKKGQLDTGELMSQFRIPQGAVNDFKEFLEKMDPAKLAKIRKGDTKGLVQEKDVDAFASMEEASHRIHDAWNRIKVLFLSRFMPILAKVGEGFADWLEDKALPAALRWGELLAANMDRIVSAAKVFVAVMTAKKLLSVLGPGGMIGNLLAGAGGGGVGGVLKAPMAMLGGMFSQLSAIVGLFSAALPFLLGIAVAVGVIYLGYKSITESVDGTFERIKVLFDTVRARFELIGESLGELWQRIEGIFGGSGTFAQFIGKLAAVSFEGLVKGFDFLMHVLGTAASMAVELADMTSELFYDVLLPAWDDLASKFSSTLRWMSTGIDKWGGVIKAVVMSLPGMQTASALWGATFGHKDLKVDLGWMDAPVKLFKKHWDKTQADTEMRQAKLTAERHLAEAKGPTGPEAPNKQPAKQNFDFRGSRFDITQNFAEGFDPDRIAVAFSDDLGRLGEKRVQSSYQPIFSAGG